MNEVKEPGQRVYLVTRNYYEEYPQIYLRSLAEAEAWIRQDYQRQMAMNREEDEPYMVKRLAEPVAVWDRYERGWVVNSVVPGEPGMRSEGVYTFSGEVKGLEAGDDFEYWPVEYESWFNQETEEDEEDEEGPEESGEEDGEFVIPGRVGLRWAAFDRGCMVTGCTVAEECREIVMEVLRERLIVALCPGHMELFFPGAREVRDEG